MSQSNSIGRYEVVHLLGEGAMGNVYKATDPFIKRTVAIKTIKLDSTRNEKDTQEFLQRFQLEAQISGTLNHPNIVSIFDVGEQDGTPYIAMEFVEGQTLSQFTQQDPRPSIGELMQILVQIAYALDFAHSKEVVHRDLKPANIMVMDNGTAKIMDFGIAKRADSHLTQTGVFLGTPSYSSPEQVREGHVDYRSDLFSLGILAHETLTGHLPFPGRTISAILYKIANEDPSLAPNLQHLPLDVGIWRQVYNKVLAKDPNQRFQSATEFLHALYAAMRLGKGENERLAATFANPVGVATASTFGVQKNLQRSEFERSLSMDKTVRLGERSATPPRAPEEPPPKPQRGILLTLLLFLGLVVAVGAAWKSGILQEFYQDLPDMAGELKKPPADEGGELVDGDKGSPGETTETPPPDTAKTLSKSLSISSQPGGASVFLGDQNLGKTPLSYVWEAPEGTQLVLRLELDRFESGSRVLVLNEELAPKVDFELSPLAITRTIRSEPEGATVRVDNRNLGKAPVEAQFVPGQTYKIRMNLDGFLTRSFTWREGKSDDKLLTAKLKPQPPPGKLSVDTFMEDLTIEANGNRVKGTAMQLSEGRQEVVLHSERYFYRERKSVTIRAGETTSLTTPIIITVPKVDFIGDYVKVRIDGNYVRTAGKIDTTPLINLKIAAGSHRFDFIDRNDKIVAQKTIEVKRSEAITVAADE
ncbi:Non-specific serine/threonine protein kinase [Sulfidibacter corallicola]|uniref:Serine/threonine protein kinase n=1 Tax=Sulfidibacter corallicola TaxID=2818388 RepID=A0A8A4TYT9_SULCO|nr:serine/threonine-protein kinase [Sulfidibacter corallicola]QTD54112.1 serine/threonine protein kinase [Sulfidibacter corallicola]